MTKQKKLKKIIEYAVEREWDKEKFWGKKLVSDDIHSYLATWHNANSLLFSHDFAKAVFGEEKERVLACPSCDFYKEYSKHETALFCEADGRKLKEGEVTPWTQEWKNLLQEAVLEKDPIDYYYKFIK